MGYNQTDLQKEAADKWIEKTIPALALLLFAPAFVEALLWAVVSHNGSMLVLLTHYKEFINLVTDLLANPGPMWTCAWYLGVYTVFQFVLSVGLPGRIIQGPVTPGGNRPTYKDNGFLAFLVTNIVILAFPGQLNGPLIECARNHLAMVLVLNIIALVVCLLLALKGVYSPSWGAPDSGRTGAGVVFDYYWGTELHPRTSSESLFDFKQFINCRLGMMGWSVLLTAFLFAHQADNGGQASNGALVSFWLQQIYIAKFFLWEGGYMSSIDIAHDRLGFYIGWGCLVWLPSLYPSGMYYLYHNSKPGAGDMPAWAAWATVAAGVACIVATYLADEQRQQVRRDNAKVDVWGKAPRVVRAKYTSADGKQHGSILVACGWWAIARHFHYLTEWGGAFLWTVPCAWVAGAGVLAWTYPIFLAILLLHRSVRDEERCAAKYGKYWKQYCEIVPYRVLPYVY